MGRHIRNIMDTNVIVVPPSAMLASVCEQLHDNSASIVVVQEKGRVVGLLTERDAVRFIHDDIDIAATNVGQVMSSPVSVIHEQATLFDAYSDMNEKRFRHLVVVDDDERLAGVVTQTDLLDGMGMEYFVELKDVSSIMTRNLVRVHPDDSIRLVVDLMFSHRISCIIVEQQWLPVGIITERDIVDLCRQGVCADHVSASTVMSSPVRTVADTTYVPEASSIMRRENLRHMVVVDAQGRLTGVISLTDLTACLENGYVSYLKELIQRKEEQLGRIAIEHGTLIRENPNPVIVFDTQGGITDANPAALRLSGHTLDALCGRSLADLVHADSSGQASEAFAQASRGEAGQIELRLQHASDGGLDAFASFLPVSVDDRVFRVYAVMHDVSQQKKLDRAQALIEQKFRALAEMTRAIAWELNLLSDRFSYVDEQIELLGYPAESWRDSTTWLQRIAASDRDKVMQHFQQAAASGEARRFDCRMVASDGREVPYIHYIVPHRQADKAVELAGFMLAAEGC